MDRNDVELTLIMRGYFPALNRDLARLVDEHPNRLVGFAALDTEPPSATTLGETVEGIRALEDGLAMPQLKGVGEVSLGRFYPRLSAEQSAEAFVRTLEVCHKFRCPIMFHTSIGGGVGAQYRNPDKLGPLAHAFPGVCILVAHMGGNNESYLRCALDLARDHRNVFLTTSGTTTAFVEFAVDEVGAERLIFGSDWSPKTVLKARRAGTNPQAIAIRTVEKAAIRPYQKASILGENVVELLGL
jgi:predicted TIM-barrel fold metal-dependent hydrolase